MIHVIIPVYNAKIFIKETVMSVLNQPYKDIDILLVDDGSTDGSSELCDEIAMQETRVFVIHQANAGVSSARNAGIEYFLQKSRNDNKPQVEYLAFLDADDLWNAGAITDDVVAQIYNLPEADIVAFGNVCCNQDLTRYSIPLVYENDWIEGGNGAIWKTRGIFSSNLYNILLFKKWNIRFQEGLKYSEDKIFLQQGLFLARKVLFQHEILHLYRNNTSSAMQKINSMSAIDYYLPIIEGWIASDDFLNRFKDKTYSNAQGGYVLAGIYFMDMIAEHYKRCGSSRELQAIKSHSHWYLFEKMQPKNVSAKQYANQQLYFGHPVIYRMKYIMIGLVERCAKLFLQFKPVRKILLDRKYPLTEIKQTDM